MNAVEINPNILGGTPVFAGTRVPVDAMFDHLRAGYTVDYFISQFPTVKRELVDAVLEMAKKRVPLDERRIAG